MQIKLRLISLFIIFTFIIAGCSLQENEKEETNHNKLIIYTTIYPLEDFTQKIGDEHVQVESVYPPGSDAHTFEPTAKTMAKIAESDAFIYLGAGAEGFVNAATETLSNEAVKMVEAGHHIPFLSAGNEHSEHEHEEESDEQHDIDPHIWLDPVLSISIAENIKNALIDLKPELKDEFEQNFAALKAELEKLDTEFNEVVNRSARKEILVSHAAYGYWEQRYGIKQISVAGLSPTQEPTQKQLQAIIATAKDHQIKYIIFEQNITTKVSEIVQKEIGAEALTLHNLEALTDNDRKNKEDYVSIMRKNIKTIEKALN